MATTMQKYRIAELEKELPRSVKLKLEIEKLGIPYRTYFTDRSIKINDQTSIPSDRLRKYAQFYKCTMEQLFNDVPTRKKVNAKTSLR